MSILSSRLAIRCGNIIIRLLEVEIWGIILRKIMKEDIK